MMFFHYFVKQRFHSFLFVCLALSVFPMHTVSAQSAAAAAEIRFQQMEREIRRLTGQIEEQNFIIRQLQDQVRMLEETMRTDGGGRDGVQAVQPISPQPAYPDQFAVQDGDGSNASGDVRGGSVSVLGTLTQSQDTGDVQSFDDAPRQYDYAYSMITAQDYVRAELAFAKFIADYPDHSLVSNAKYWYGETFYVRDSYEKAARIFAEGYKLYPDGSKAPDNLLKLGMSLIGMGKTDDACIALKQLKKDYSSSSVPVLKRADTEMKKINCT